MENQKNYLVKKIQKSMNVSTGSMLWAPDDNNTHWMKRDH